MCFCHCKLLKTIASACIRKSCINTTRFIYVYVTQLHANLDQPAYGQHRANHATNQLQVEGEHGDHPRIVWILPLQLGALSTQTRA